MSYILIIWYIIFIFILFSLILKRMKYLSKRQAENTGIESLSNWYRKVRIRMLIFALIMIILNSIIFLTFFQNELLWKKMIYSSEETLDNNAF